MSEQDKLKVNFIFTVPNMAGGTKSCRLLAEEMQRQGADVVIYHPTERPKRNSKKDKIKRMLAKVSGRNIVKNSNKESSGMRHHLETCEVPVVAIEGDMIRENDVRQADFNIANFWLQRLWLNSWSHNKGIPGLYVRGHANVDQDPALEQNLTDAYNSGGVTITHAHWLKHKLETEYDIPYAIIAPNGVDRDQFPYRPRQKQKIKKIGFQYSASPRKGAKALFAAFEELLKDDPSLQLISYGSEEVHENDKDRPNWTHECRPDYERICSLYYEADCWVVPSLSEGLPMPGLEAAACGCPVVATLCGGPEDYITQGKSGFLVEVNDVKAMAEGMRQIIHASDEEWSAMSTQSYQNSLNFDWTKSASHLIDELTKIKTSSSAEVRHG